MSEENSNNQEFPLSTDFDIRGAFEVVEKNQRLGKLVVRNGQVFFHLDQKGLEALAWPVVRNRDVGSISFSISAPDRFSEPTMRTIDLRGTIGATDHPPSPRSHAAVYKDYGLPGMMIVIWGTPGASNPERCAEGAFSTEQWTKLVRWFDTHLAV